MREYLIEPGIGFFIGLSVGTGLAFMSVLGALLEIYWGPM